MTELNTHKKIKVVWLCHFSNQKVRDQIPLSDKRILKAMKQRIGKGSVRDYYDFAPWVTNLIKEFEGFKNVELHIISPMAGLKKMKHSFEMNGIYYHFYKPDLPFIHSDFIDKSILKKPKYRINRFLVKGFIKKFKPDIVNLIGAENPYYSIAALDIKDIPVYVSCQTVYSNPERAKHGDRINHWRWEIEERIHKKFNYFGCSGRMHRDLLLNNNPGATVFKMYFPIEKFETPVNNEKKYDFVFFAGMVKKKGVEDAIHALALVKKKYPSVTLNIVGKLNTEYHKKLEDLIDESGLQENVSFTDYFPSHQELHKHIVQAHFAVLPLKLDVISSSIREAILLGLPVVCYKTSGTPYLNKNGEAVLLSEIDDIDGLAKNMTSLMDSPQKAESLKTNAKAFVDKEYDNTASALRLLQNYKAVLNNYHQQKPIPEELLFSEQEFPIY